MTFKTKINSIQKIKVTQFLTSTSNSKCQGPYIQTYLLSFVSSKMYDLISFPDRCHVVGFSLFWILTFTDESIKLPLKKLHGDSQHSGIPTPEFTIINPSLFSISRSNSTIGCNKHFQRYITDDKIPTSYN